MVLTLTAKEPLKQRDVCKWSCGAGLAFSQWRARPAGRRLLGRKWPPLTLKNALPFRRLGLLVSDHRIFHKHKSGSVLKYRPRYLYNISLTKETCLCVNLASRPPVCYSGPLVLESKFLRWIFRHWSTSLNLAEWHLAFSSEESYSPTSLSHPCSPLGSSLPSSPPTTDLFIFKSFSSDTFKNIVSTSYQL